VSTSAGKKTSSKGAAKRAAPAKKKLPPAKKAASAHAPRPSAKTGSAKAAGVKKPAPDRRAAAVKKAAAPDKRAAGARKAAPGPAAKAKSAPAKTVKTVKVTKPAKPVAKTPAPLKKPTPAPSPAAGAAKVAVPAPGVPHAVPPGVVPRKAGRGTPKYFVAPVQAPLPPPTSRFADRFAPPRPPTREMNKLDHDAPRERHKSDPKLANAWKSKAGRELTDAEVLAMPDSEYMNEKQIEFFRMKLEALKNDLLSNAGETTEHLREDTSIVPDPADRATIEEEHALELRTRDRERKLLKKISQSLARLESGDYGFCDETGEPIGLGRLIARPTATLSLEAQQRRELKQKMFGD
jgi:DnaK suppressor protein